MATINIGQDFSLDPLGRFYSDGDGSGEAFREDVLKPCLLNLKEGEKVEIILDDGVESYGSSFLVEGFAGLVKYGYFRSDELLDKLTFRFSDEDFAFYRDKILSYIKAAKFESKKYIPTNK